MSGKIKVIPSARRLIGSLRDLGYDFVQAIADLVDNSIAARATEVKINVAFEGENSWVSISDNGHGMSKAEIAEAMRLGSERDYDDSDLGKFGLGLKTASLSQCRRLIVFSRSSRTRRDVVGYSWDLDHLEKTDRWEILEVRFQSGAPPAVRNELAASTGTIVVWEKLDRFGLQESEEEVIQKRLATMCRELEQHLAMVFHKFISGEVRGKKLKLSLNGNPINAWDPFVRDERKTKHLSAVRIPVKTETANGEILLEPFVLPQRSEFSSPQAFDRASGPASWAQQQGFYVYRAGRLIQSGGWCRLRTSDEHLKLARVAISFAPKFDELFKVNVAKMRVQLPTLIRAQVFEAIKPLLRIAQETYRKKDATPSAGAINSRPTVSGGASWQTQTGSTRHSDERPTTPPTINAPNDPLFPTNGQPAPVARLSMNEFQSLMEIEANPDELPVVTRVCQRLQKRMAKQGVSR